MAIDIDSLIPAKVAQETSIGIVYVRHLRASDLDQLKGADSIKLGNQVLQLLVGWIEDKHDVTPLPDADLSRLSETDHSVLAPVIAKKNGWKNLPDDQPIEALGQVAKRERDNSVEQSKKMFADMKSSLDASYGFLNTAALDRLQSQMADISSLRDMVRNRYVDPMTSLRKAGPTESITSPPVTRVQEREFEFPRVFRPEDSPMGRAAIENAQSTRDVAQQMAALINVVGGLNQTVVSEVLPSWFRQAKSDAEATKASQEHAAKGIHLAWLAIAASVVVTIGATAYQIKVSRDIDREGSAQQLKIEALLREQLAAQQKLIGQQARDAEELRAVVFKIREAAAVPPRPSANANSTAPAARQARRAPAGE